MAGALVTTNVLQTVVSMALSALRERIVLARIANRDYTGQITGQQKNATVNIVVPAAVPSRDVAPDVVPPAVTAGTPTNVPVTLSQWKEAPFIMDDKGLAQVDRGIIPNQLSEAVKTIANGIDNYLWTLVHGAGGFFGYAGIAGTTPFATDLNEYLSAVQQADAQLMPADNRYVVLDTFAKAQALGLNAIQNAAWRGDPEAFRSGNIGTVLGADWDFSQNVPQHTAGTASGGTTDSTGYAIGLKTITMASAGSGTVLVGDIITFAGDSQPYVITAGDADISNGGTLSFYPGLKKTIAASPTAFTVKATHRCNLLVHRDALAFAMSPLISSTAIEGLNKAEAIAIDEMSGLSLRLEVTRQYKQDQWALDALYGGAVVRPEYGVRIAG